ncbi:MULTISPECIES: ABC transporter ATP-binding protein [unclassified Acidisoma]|uniref:ABC transporter ATP-binding protein n=1 Tax=unclassified Acidisoma TaxID=2634065 RepID=UPI00131BC86A|nr:MULTISPECIES: ABC transporter ATP-binding protein [unclassified Acidisoma]
MPGVTIEGLQKWYGGSQVIRDLHLTIPDGAFVALVGPSGCGKSTTLRMIAGLEMPSGGRIYIGSEDVTARPPAKRGVAMVFQSYALYPHMTVRDNLEFGLRVAGAKLADRVRRVTAAAEMLHLSDLMERRPSQLSGGQRQRVAIGRALVREPSVFLFDEPLSNLDAQLRAAMRIEIKRLHQTLRTTVIFVTHDQTEAMTMADTIVVMRDGNLEQIGSPLEVFERPANRFVAGFIGAPSMRMFDGRVEQDRMVLADGTALQLPGHVAHLAEGTEVTMGLRPEDLVVEGHGTLPVRPCFFEAPVLLTEPLGNETLIVMPFAESEAVARMYRPRPVAPGEVLRFAVDLDRIHVFDQKSGESLRRASAPGQT